MILVILPQLGGVLFLAAVFFLATPTFRFDIHLARMEKMHTADYRIIKEVG